VPGVNIIRKTPIIRTPRVLQLEGIFDISPTQQSELEWKVNLPIEEREWNIGLIVGPSGSGKTTIAKELFKGKLVEEFEWDPQKAIIDNFPEDMSIQEIVALLSSVGFSSPPSWLRPYHVLSNGEKFRAFIARALAEFKDLVVIDEFTSVVDRTVAKATSWTVQKIVRKRNQKIVAVTCHYDVIDWLQPDWVFDPAVNKFDWGDGLQRRPEVTFKVKRVHKSAWEIFKKHHYLTAQINPSAQCYIAFIEENPVAFCAILMNPARSGKSFYRISRVVILPDYQGLGIGRKLASYIASLYATKKPVKIVTSHPAMINSLLHSGYWKVVRKLSLCTSNRGIRGKEISKAAAWNRLTVTLQYIGKPNFNDARSFGVL